ncbi:MAG: hypothetical protein BGO09_03800 [Bacteroidetes bacterium 47-18]|nr:MAG: hypothetical protein BGO09_03800 [Bacteroidetes bacterium 47-18]
MERLFDIVREKSEKAPNNIMLAAKKNGAWITYDNREVYTKAQSIACGLIGNGLYSRQTDDPEAQVKIALISPNRPEWVILDLAVQMTGAILTPIYPTISNNEFEYVLNQAAVKAVFFANADLYNKFKSCIPNIPSIEFVYSIDVIPGVAHYESLNHDAENTRLLYEITSGIRSEDIATIIYTSGTTGKPKGVMLSHANILSNVKDTEPVFYFAEAGEKALSFLPLNHIFERTITYIYINAGVSIYYAESLDTIGDNLKEVKPIVFTCVPRLLEKVYDKIMAKGYEQKGIKRMLFFWAVRTGDAFDDSRPQSWWYRLKLRIANKIVFSKWREALGGKIRAVVSGAAALNPKLARIFTAGGITVMEGYGLTETSPVISVNLLQQEGRRIGTVGLPIRNVTVKIAEDGEILVKGPNVMVGYYKNPEQTAEIIDKDGWLATGDIGTMVDGKFLKITDRKKEIFKTSGGKYVAPQAIEGTLRESKYIEQVIVIGPDRKFVSALIYPDYEKVVAKLKANNVQLPSTDKKDLARNKDVIALIQKQLDYYNPQFNHVEQIKKFTLISEEMSVDNGLLTPKLSMRRKQIYERFEKEIEEMYKES